MSDKDLLLAISDMMDKKLSEQLTPIKQDITDLKTNVADLKTDVAGLKTEVADLKKHILNVEIDLENVIRPDIKRLAENYLPAAVRYEQSGAEIEAMKTDIEVLKKVVREHSKKLEKIS